VSSYQPYPAYSAGAPLQLADPLPVEVAVTEPERQHRLTVAFRLILIIPHLFLLFFLSIAAAVVAFLGWWGALFTARLPQFAVTYLAGFLTWYLRVMAYLFLLTDAYPPFTLDDDPAYPVRLAVPERQRLNRFAVFFRVILMIPAAIVAGVVVEGASSIVLFIGWLITLIAGRMPQSLHQAFAAVIRYQTRFNCYFYMLTPAYAWGLFGDSPGASSAAGRPGYPAPDAGYGPPPPGYGTAPGYGSDPGYGAGPGYGATDPAYGAPGGYGQPPGYGQPGGYGQPPGYGQPSGYGPGHTMVQPTSWQLVLTSAAKGLLALFLVLGVVTYIFSAIRDAAIFNRASNVATVNNAIDELNSSYNTLKGNLTQLERAVADCDQNLTCVTRQDAHAAGYFTTFASQLRATQEPPGAVSAANQVYSDATGLAQAYTQLGQAKNVAQYRAAWTRTGLQQLGNSFNQDVNALGTALNNS
jgi:hypothetical protein